MATPTIHPSRAAFFAAPEQPSVTPAAEPLPPDVEAARKQRINLDLIGALKHPCPPNTVASIQGIGLYTHIAAPSQAPLLPHEKHVKTTPDPVFLPVGGPRGTQRPYNVVQPQASNQVKEIYHQLQQEMDEEEKHLGRGDASMDSLKKRYGCLDVPEGATTAQKEPQPQLGLQGILNSLQDAAMTDMQNTTAGHGDRRQSLGGGAIQDVIMGGTEQERIGTASVTKAGNTYEAARDPRLRGG
jgi:hypothetical protein